MNYINYLWGETNYYELQSQYHHKLVDLIKYPDTKEYFSLEFFNTQDSTKIKIIFEFFKRNNQIQEYLFDFLNKLKDIKSDVVSHIILKSDLRCKIWTPLQIIKIKEGYLVFHYPYTENVESTSEFNFRIFEFKISPETFDKLIDEINELTDIIV